MSVCMWYANARAQSCEKGGPWIHSEINSYLTAYSQRDAVQTHTLWCIITHTEPRTERSVCIRLLRTSCITSITSILLLFLSWPSLIPSLHSFISPALLSASIPSFICLSLSSNPSFQPGRALRWMIHVFILWWKDELNFSCQSGCSRKLLNASRVHVTQMLQGSAMPSVDPNAVIIIHRVCVMLWIACWSDCMLGSLSSDRPSKIHVCAFTMQRTGAEEW